MKFINLVLLCGALLSLTVTSAFAACGKSCGGTCNDGKDPGTCGYNYTLGGVFCTCFAFHAIPIETYSAITGSEVSEGQQTFIVKAIPVTPEVSADSAQQ